MEFPNTACAVCGHVLNLYSSAFGQSWVHALEEDNDHPAVPVPADAIHTIKVCDFCLEPNAPWVLPVRTYFVWTQGRSLGDWQCCSACASLLERHSWNNLLFRAMEGAKGRMPEADRKVEVFEEIYRQLREHIIGRVRLDR